MYVTMGEINLEGIAMSEIFECTRDGECPSHIHQAGLEGRLEVYSAIGWIVLSEDDYGGVRNGCTYRVELVDITCNIL
jgi:hypothetical protein